MNAWFWIDANDSDTVIIGTRYKLPKYRGGGLAYNAWAAMHIDGVSDLFGDAVRNAIRLAAGTPVQVPTCLADLYGWCVENGVSVAKFNDGTWWAYDANGDQIDNGRSMEEAAWGAWDRAREIRG